MGLQLDRPPLREAEAGDVTAPVASASAGPMDRNPLERSVNKCWC
jgi:hypothetical protein